MAEFVQQSIEEMLPELEQMERIGLFTTNETRSILKKRKAHEYKLRKRTKQKEDFLLYIQYEISVLNLVRRRRKKSGINYKQLDIDVPVINRIHKLFKLVCRRFSDDVKLWLSHIEFCKKRKDKAPVGNMFVEMLQIHSRKPGLWVLAAQWEMEEGLSMENARGLLQRGLRFNPKSEHLWREYFRMELLNTDKLRKRQEILGMDNDANAESPVPDSVLKGQVASLVFNKAMEAVSDNVEFCVLFVPICRLFDFTQDLEEDIFECLQVNFSQEEVAWEVNALRSLQRAAQPKHDQQKRMKKAAEREVLRKENEAVEIFDKAVMQLNTEKMWSLYVKFCLGRLNTKSSKQASSERISRALSVFQQAQDKHKLTSDLYLQWAELLSLTGDVVTRGDVLEAGLGSHPGSVDLWTARLKDLIDTGAQPQAIQTSIRHAMESVPPEKCCLVLDLALDWSSLICPEYTEDLLKICIANKSVSISVPMKEAYLEWTSSNSDIHKFRTTYNKLKTTKPLSINFYKKYIAVENSEPKPKIKRLRQGYEDVLQDYGSTVIDLWLDYIKLEHTHPMGTPESAGKIHWRALKTIDGELTDDFITMYTLLQNNKLT